MFSQDGKLATVHTWDNQFGSREDLFVNNHNLSAGFDHDFWSCSQTRVAWVGDRLLASTMDGVDLRLYRFSMDGSAPFALTPAGGSVDAFSSGPNGAIYVAYSTPEKPDEIYRIDADVEFFKMLREEGKNVALLAYPDAGHGPDNPLGALDWTAHIAGWFASHGGVSIGDAKLPPSSR